LLVKAAAALPSLLRTPWPTIRSRDRPPGSDLPPVLSRRHLPLDRSDPTGGHMLKTATVADLRMVLELYRPSGPW